MDSRQPPRPVAEAVERYLVAADDALPGLVERLYLVGSAVTGAWQPGVSDVDTVVFTSRPLTGDDLAVIPELPKIDGPYLEPALHDLWPADQRVAPHVVRDEFRGGEPCFELTPVLWLTFRKYGLAVRGPAPADLGVRVDGAELRSYNLANLRDFWQANVAGVPEHLKTADLTEPFDGDLAQFYILGPARLHFTLAHEDIIPKVAAGDYLVSLFPEDADLVRRAVAWRAGEPERFTLADLGPIAASVNRVVDDAWRRFGR